MPNAKDYQGAQKNFLLYGRTGCGKSTAFLTHPGKKFCYIFDPSGLETFAGHDVEYEYFAPEIVKIKTGKLGKDSKSADMLRPDPDTFERFEKDFENRVSKGFFKDFDIIGFESCTTLLDLIMWYILDRQGKGNSAPEIQDYYFRADGFANIIRTAVAQRLAVFCSAHIETSQDEVTKRIETGLALPPALQNKIPLLFSEVVPLFAELDEKKGDVHYYAQFAPDKRIQSVRSSIKGVKPREDITVDWNQPLEGQGFMGLYLTKPQKTAEELKEQGKIKMGGGS